jgi:hypothetical protein
MARITTLKAGAVGQSGVSQPFDCDLGGTLRFVSSTAFLRTAEGLRPVKKNSVSTMSASTRTDHASAPSVTPPQ